MLTVLLLVLAAPGDTPDWVEGDHLTGDWAGARTSLEDRGITVGLAYTSELFASALRPPHGPFHLAHVDVALTLDTGKLGLWSGGTLFVFGQHNYGHGINEVVGSANTISNLEDSDFSHFCELFFEQSWLDGALVMRIGKQDASRDFALSAYGSDFINNNFGMFPTSPLPNYAATGLGAVLVAQPFEWLTARAGLYEGKPAIGSLGLDTALAPGAGFSVAGGLAVAHHVSSLRGTTSVSLWGQRSDDFADGYNLGVFAQHDEQLLLNPTDEDDERGLVATLRFAWADPTKTRVWLYAAAALTWRGVASRHDDTIGIGFGGLGLTDPPNSTELHLEVFYNLRVTNFVRLQPTVQFVRSPGGANPDALIAGLRIELLL